MAHKRKTHRRKSTHRRKTHRRHTHKNKRVQGGFWWADNKTGAAVAATTDGAKANVQVTAPVPATAAANNAAKAIPTDTAAKALNVVKDLLNKAPATTAPAAPAATKGGRRRRTHKRKAHKRRKSLRRRTSLRRK
jgi:hypothetical protein